MVSSGLCIIPEGNHIKGLSDKGYPYEVSKISCLDDILRWSKKHNLDVMYLMYKDGLCYSDDIVQYSNKKLSSYSGMDFRLWSCIIAKEIMSMCLSRSLATVYLMNTKYYPFSELVKIVKSMGLKIEMPILGENRKSIKDKLGEA